MLDLAIVGSGPAALSAALYAARLGLSVRILEKEAFGGLLAQISDLRNYPGFQGSGAALAEQMHQQVAAYEQVNFSYGECASIKRGEQGFFELEVDDDEKIASRAVLLASGASPKHLNFELNVPISYCALCDGELARGKRVAVVGGANAAVQESLFLSPLVSSIDLFTHSQLKADPVLQAELRKLPNVQIHERIEPTPDPLNQFEYVFVFIGHVPKTQYLQNLAEYPKLVDQRGWILTGEQASGSNFAHETAVPGLFAAGDVRAGMIRQVVTATGDGAAAAIEVAEYLACGA